MNKLQYPTLQELVWWIEFLSDENRTLKLSLPVIDDVWYEQIMEVVQRVQYSYSEDALHNRAAELFYNANKAHNYTDGNKRSSIVITYLFYLTNNHYIMSSLNIRALAKKVARSHGRNRHDWWIEKITKQFEKHTAPLA